MSGWRHFGIEIDEVLEVKLRLKFSNMNGNNNIEMTTKDGFICITLAGYAPFDEDKSIDDKLRALLIQSDRKGYYVHMNDTTDTASGIIRFNNDKRTVEIADLVNEDSDDPNFDRKELPLFQMEEPYWGTVYDLLFYYDFPVESRY